MKVDLKHTIKGALLGGVVLFTGTGVMGCSEKGEVPNTISLLEGTILEDTYVITDSNDNTFVVRPTEEYYGIDVSCFNDNYANHYIDLLSNNCYHENPEDSEGCYNEDKGIFPIDIVSRVPISVYLTEEDLSKEEFTDEDIVEIIQRARDGSSIDTNVTIEEKGAEYTK